MAKRYEQHRPVALSIRAANERFSPDAGDRDDVAGTIVSNGRAGYLQMGPGIPMKAGTYRARWIGTVTAVGMASLDSSTSGRAIASSPGVRYMAMTSIRISI